MISDIQKLESHEIIVSYDISQQNSKFRDDLRDYLTDECGGEEQSESVYRITVPGTSHVVTFCKNLAESIDSRIRKNDKVFLYFLAQTKSNPTNFIWTIEISK